MVATCHTLLCNHISNSEICSGSAHQHTETFVWTMFSPYVCVCIFGAISTLSTQVKRNNYMFVYLFPNLM